MIKFSKDVCKCGNNTFEIMRHNSCSDCSRNGAYDPEIEDYVYDEKIIKEKGLNRDEAQENGVCEDYTACGSGCILSICSKCREEKQLVFMVEQ